MDIQNFRLFQNYKYKEKQLESVLQKQRSTIQLLRQEYESLKNNKRKDEKNSPAEKLMRKRNLRSIYTFKLPESKQKNVNETKEERYRYGWYQRPLTDLPSHIQKLYQQRNQMIQLGNSYSKNNQKYPLVTKTISRATSAKTANDMKYEMLRRGKELGNHYSHRYRENHPPTVYKKSINYYKEHERLINQKNEMEKVFTSGAELPQQFPQKYLRTVNEIRRVEGVLKPKRQLHDGDICQQILQLDASTNAKLLTELNRPSMKHTDGENDKIGLNEAVEKIEIGKILEAVNAVDRSLCDMFKDEVDSLLEMALNQADSADKSNEDGLSGGSSVYYDVQQSKTNFLASSESLTAKISPDIYLGGMNILLEPKHFPSLENLQANQISTAEHALNIKDDQQTDDSQETSRVSHEICKSHAESSHLCGMTSTSTIVEKPHTSFPEPQQTKMEIHDDKNKPNEYSGISCHESKLHADKTGHKIHKLLLHV